MRHDNGGKRRMVSLAGCAAMIFGMARVGASLAAASPADIEANVQTVLKQMTLVEKVAMCHGNSLFTVAAVQRLGIPEMSLSDGPRGVREEQNRDGFGNANLTNDHATALPCGSALAATWDVDAAGKYGHVLNGEARNRKKDIILGPSVNIQRMRLGGRNYEYMSEDPFLVSRIVVREITAIQSQGTAACIKHFACNSQELSRFTVNGKISERALREIFLPSFEAAVKEAGVLSLMAAYNRVNGETGSQNEHLISILKKEWWFQGVLMTDWRINGLKTIPAALNGLSLEMGSGKHFEQYCLAQPMLDAVKGGKVPESLVDDKARRHLRVLFAIGAMGQGECQAGSRNTAEHKSVAHAIATQCAVLLKNDARLLPLKTAGLRKLVVIGDNAVAKHSRGGQSAAVKSLYEISPSQGLKAKLGDKAKIAYYPGYTTVRPKKDATAAAQADKVDRLRAETVAAAKVADAVLYVGGQTSGQDSEGSDRPDMKLP